VEARCLARNGRRREALDILANLEQRRAGEYVDAFYLALVEDALGRRDAAFRELERALEENSVMFFLMDVDPKLDGLRADPRFAALRERVFAVDSSVCAVSA